MKDGCYVIDADGHVSPDEAVDWHKYMPGPIADEVTGILRKKIQRMHDARAVTPEMARQGFKNVRDPYPKRQGGWDPAARLKDMDLDGIDEAILFPTIVASPGTPYPHPLETSQGYHDWLAEFCNHNPKRLKGVVAATQVEDTREVVKEVRRCVSEHGFVGVITRVHNFGKTLAHPYYTPLFTEAETLDIPIMVHLGARVREWMAEELKYSFTESFGFGHPASSMIGLMDILYGGWLEKLKSIRFALLEGEITWLPFWLHRLDARYEKLPHHAPTLKKLPSDYFKEGRIFISVESEEPDLAYTINTWAEDIAVYNSDYPHWDATFPGSVQELMEQKSLTHAQKKKILGENALMLLYGKKGAKVPIGGR